VVRVRLGSADARFVFPLIPVPNRLRVLRDTAVSNQLGGSREEDALHERADRLRAVAGVDGQTIAEICQRLGVSEQTFYRWMRKSCAMGVTEI